MDEHRSVLMGMYRAYNNRDIEGATEFLAPEVDWPDVETGGRLTGREAVRADFERQWRDSNPRVEPLRIETDDAGNEHVHVDQLIKSPDGRILSNGRLVHVFTFDGAFIARMVIVDPEPEGDDADNDEDDDDDGA